LLGGNFARVSAGGSKWSSSKFSECGRLRVFFFPLSFLPGFLISVCNLLFSDLVVSVRLRPSVRVFRCEFSEEMRSGGRARSDGSTLGIGVCLASAAFIKSAFL
jgi:hypothetical protein